MCEAVTLFAPVVVTFHVRVLPSLDNVNVAVPTAGDVFGVGRSFAALRVDVNVSGPGSLVESHAATNAIKPIANHLLFMGILLVDANEQRHFYWTVIDPFMKGCGMQW